MAARGSERIRRRDRGAHPRAAGAHARQPDKLSEQALGAVRALVDELNLASRDEVDELELRVAQLEHRLRLLEQRDDAL